MKVRRVQLVTWSESEEGSSRPQRAGCPGPGETTGLGPPARCHRHQDDRDHYQDERSQGKKYKCLTVKVGRE